MAKQTEQRQPLPPYIPFKTFEGFIKRLKETTVPERVDSSILRSYSGSAASQLTGALRYLALIEEGGKATTWLGSLVDAYATPQWQNDLASLITQNYQKVVGNLNLSNATYGQVVEKFKSLGTDGQMLQKCVTFYIAALKAAGVAISPHISNRPRTKRNGTGNRRAKTKDITEEKDQVNDGGTVPLSGSIRFSFPIPDKQAATIVVPSDLETEDWDMIDAMIKAYISRRVKTQR